MTPHDHSEYVEGCYRCELGADEALATATDVPWVANCDFTVRGDSEDEVLAKINDLRAAARRLGISDPHTDYSGPDKEPTDAG